MSRSSYHRHRLVFALALGAWLALTACVEAPPTAPDGPDAMPTSLIPITPQQLTDTLGDSLGLLLETRVLGPDGQPLRSAVVVYDVVSGAGVFTADSTLTNDQGFTQVLFLPLSPGTVLVQARSGADAITFAIEVANDPNQGSTFLKVGGDTQSATVGAILPQPFTVQVRNPDGLPVDSVPVTFTIQIAQGDSAKLATDPSAFQGAGGETGSSGHQVVVLTDAGGFARAWLRLGTLAGGHTVSATALIGPAGAQTEQTVNFTANALPSARATQLIIISGDDQTVPIDTLFPPGSPLNRTRNPNPFVVQALDAFGTPVSGVAVQWRVSDGGGTMFAFTTFTDAFGFATNALFGPTEGHNAVVAIAPGTGPVTFDVNGELIAEPEEGGGDDEEGGGGG
ncbi:MAG TPA: Ig-like domain-containing protein, partial [Gemmatimonadota bacterium]|nr:Ig-like domain-containing protein [Gemmatimonadota bacterium]